MRRPLPWPNLAWHFFLSLFFEFFVRHLLCFCRWGFCVCCVFFVFGKLFARLHTNTLTEEPRTAAGYCRVKLIGQRTSSSALALVFSAAGSRVIVSGMSV